MATVPPIGANSAISFQLETTYGSDPGSPAGTKIGVLSGSGIGATQALGENMLLRSNPNLADSILLRKDASGNINTYATLKAFPHLAKFALGSMATTGSVGNYVHTAKIAAGAMPSWTVEHNFDMAGTDQFFKSNGVVCDSFKISGGVDGFVMTDLQCVAAKTTNGTSALYTSPTDLTSDTPIHGLQIASTDLKLGAFGSMSAFSDLLSIDITVSHNVDKSDYRMSQNGIRSSAQRARSKVSGTLKFMYVDTTAYNLIAGGAACALECKWTIGTNQSILVRIPRLFFTRRDPIPDSESSITLSADFIAAYDPATDLTSMVIVTNNDQAGTVY